MYRAQGHLQDTPMTLHSNKAMTVLQFRCNLELFYTWY